MRNIRNSRLVGGVVALSVAVLGWTSDASGALVAAWNFNSYSAGTYIVGADWGSGTMTVDASWLSGDLLTAAGTTMNAVGSDIAGNAIQFRSSTNNGKGVQFAISTVGLEDLVLTFASSGTGAGFDLNQVSYSTNGGGSFTNFGSTYDPPTGYALHTFDFSSIAALDNNSQVVIRIALNGANNTGGTNNIDNVQFNANPIPAPGALALLGIAGLLGSRRRRRA